MNLDNLKTALINVAEKHGVNNFICLVSFEGSELDNPQAQTIFSITHIKENSAEKSLFQWLRRQIILKLQ